MAAARTIWLFPFLCIFIWTAWLSDDAFVTFRTVDNFLMGHGLRFNVAERVQGFTHPLWALFLIPFGFVYRDFFVVGHVVQLLTSCLTIYLFYKIFKLGLGGGILFLTLFVASDAFVSYSTSGLENPLSHLLALLFFYACTKITGPKQAYFSTFVAGLLLLTRLDFAVLVAPALAAQIWQTRRQIKILDWAKALSLAAIAPVLWHIFSLFYYGSLVPNTAFAKLLNSWTRGDLNASALKYFMWTWENDPITFCAIALGIVIGVGTRQWRNLSIAMGIVFYLVYLCHIGGDFMGGRFFSTLYLLSLCLLACSWESIQSPRLRAAVAVIGTGIVFAFIFEYSVWFKEWTTDYKLSDRCTGGLVTDERACYQEMTGLLSKRRIEENKARNETGVRIWWRELGERWAREKTTVVAFPNIGIAGYYAGPSVHIVDNLALTDPLLARLRPVRWLVKTGHYARLLPYGYLETLDTGNNVILDPKIKSSYDKLLLILRGRLFSGERLALILQGEGMREIEFTKPEITLEVNESRFHTHAPVQEWWNRKNILATRGGIRIALRHISHAKQFKLALDQSDIFEISFWQGKKNLGVLKTRTNSLQPEDVIVPAEVVVQGYDAIKVTPIEGDEIYALIDFQMPP